MASLNLTPEELKALEQTRQRLFQLSTSIQSLRNNVFNSHPLPQPSSLQASTTILQKNLQSLLEIVTENNDVFSHIAVHPSTNFDGRTKEHVLGYLLRKKLEPDVETWVEQGREHSRTQITSTDMDGIGAKLMSMALPPGSGHTAGVGINGSSMGGAMSGHHNGQKKEEQETNRMVEEQEAFASAVGQMMQEKLTDYVENESRSYFTAEERARYGADLSAVRTGLRRNLAKEEMEEMEDEEEDDEDVDMIGAGPTNTQADGAGSAQNQQTQAAPNILPEFLFSFGSKSATTLARNLDIQTGRRAKEMVPSMTG